MIVVKASKDSDASKLPSQELLAARGRRPPRRRRAAGSTNVCAAREHFKNSAARCGRQKRG